MGRFGWSSDQLITKKMMLSTLFMMSMAASCMGQIEWGNDYDGQLYFECPEGSAISHIQSIHDNSHEDRIWGFECAVVENLFDSCAWTGYVNNFDETFVYECTAGAGIITGMESEHDNRKEDRRWSYKCCEAVATCYHDCHFTPYINDLDQPMDYTVQDGYMIAGVESEHDNHSEDRKWRLQLCKVQSC